MVNDVVTVHASRSRPQVRRGVAMGNAQSGEIRNQLGGVRKGEIPIELQAIHGKRDVKKRAHSVRNQAADQGGIRSPSTAAFPAFEWSVDTAGRPGSPITSAAPYPAAATRLAASVPRALSN